MYSGATLSLPMPEKDGLAQSKKSLSELNTTEGAEVEYGPGQ
jgi:hypothetical protein